MLIRVPNKDIKKAYYEIGEIIKFRRLDFIMEETMSLDRQCDINEIIAIDMVLGDLAREAEECYNNSLYAAANACLFLLSEHAIKHGVEELDSNLSMLLSKAKKIGIISEGDFLILDHLGVTPTFAQ